MNVPEGFKQAEIEVLPDDWDLIPTACLVEPSTPICYGIVQVGQNTDNGVPIVAIKYVKNINTAPLHQASISLEQSYSRSRIKGGDILISIKGTIGRVGIVPDGFAGNIGRELARLRIKEEYSAEYIAHQLEADRTQARISKSIVGTTRLEFSIFALRQFSLPIPSSLHEQRAIAAALSDTDALIEGVEKLLEKKRRIKQGAMQELLRPKAGWNEKELGECADIIGGGTPSSFNNLFWNGNINWFTPTEVGFSKYLYESKRKITESGYRNSSAKMLPAGAILLTSRAGIGDLGILTKEGCTNQGFQSLVARENIDNEFLYYLMGTLKGQLHQNASGSTFLEITPRRLGKIKVFVPKKPKQEEIAAILSDMDSEIEELETQLTKYRQLKTGMMQELLTGKKRLV